MDIMNIWSLLYTSNCLYHDKEYSETLKFDLLPGMKQLKQRKFGKEYIVDRKKSLTDVQKRITEEETYLTQARKDLFENIVAETIPTEKIPLINAFFSKYRKAKKDDTTEITVAQLLDTIDVDQIPLDKTPALVWFLADYLESSYKKTMFEDVKPYTKEMRFMEQTNMNTSVYEINFSVRVYNALKSIDMCTVWDLIVSYKANPKGLLAYPNFWKKSNNELEGFLKEHQLI